MSSSDNSGGKHFASSTSRNQTPDRSSDYAGTAGEASQGSAVEEDGDTLRNIYGRSSSVQETVTAAHIESDDTDMFLAALNVENNGQPNDAAAAAPEQAPSDVPVNPLVAARNNGNRANGAASGNDLFPMQDVETTPASGSFDTTFGETHHRRTALIIVIIVVVVIVVFLAVFFGLRYKEASDARENIDEAVSLLRDTDTVIVPLDAAIAEELNSGTASDTVSGLMLQSTSTSTNLSSAESLAADASKSDSLLNDDEKDVIDAIQNSVSARRSILEVGRMLSSTDTSASEAEADLEGAYLSIANANDKMSWLSDEWAQYWGGDWGIDLWELIDVDNDVISEITNAQEHVAAASEAFSSGDFSIINDYLAAYREQLDVLVQVDTLIANGDVDAAGTMDSEQYAPLKDRTEELAAQLPGSASEMMASARATINQSQSEAYTAAREKCLDADTIINEYADITGTSEEIGLAASDVALLDAAELNDATVGSEEAEAVSDEEGAPEEEPAPEEGASEEAAPEEEGAAEGEAAPEEGSVPDEGGEA